MGLEDDPFDWRITRDGQLLASPDARPGTTVRGVRAAMLLARLERVADDEAQHLLARATGDHGRGDHGRGDHGRGDHGRGDYGRGNERG